jgi:Holliday junction resolvase-like predicted endonuclease
MLSFFSTITDKIGEDIVYDPTTHLSIVEIKNHVDVEKNVEFQHITSDKIEKIIDKTNIKPFEKNRKDTRRSIICFT